MVQEWCFSFLSWLKDKEIANMLDGARFLISFCGVEMEYAIYILKEWIKHVEETGSFPEYSERQAKRWEEWLETIRQYYPGWIENGHKNRM